MAISIDQFVHQLADSSLMSADEVAALIDSLPAEKKPRDGEQLAKELVRQKKLTAYQTQQMYAGKGKSLVLGNYVILDKLGQGGMDLMLKAEHRRMKRLVALKVLSPKVTKSTPAPNPAPTIPGGSVPVSVPSLSLSPASNSTSRRQSPGANRRRSFTASRSRSQPAPASSVSRSTGIKPSPSLLPSWRFLAVGKATVGEPAALPFSRSEGAAQGAAQNGG